MTATDTTKPKSTTKQEEVPAKAGSNGPKREEYAKLLKAQLKELDEKADEAFTRAKELSAKAQERFEKDLAEIRERKKQLQQRLEKFQQTADEDWKRIRGEMEQAGEHVKNALDTMIDRIKSAAKREKEETKR